jgi:hypothetical protein
MTRRKINEGRGLRSRAFMSTVAETVGFVFLTQKMYVFSIGLTGLPLRHRFSAAQKSFKNKRFSNRRLLHGGALRWSTL